MFIDQLSIFYFGGTHAIALVLRYLFGPLYSVIGVGQSLVLDNTRFADQVSMKIAVLCWYSHCTFAFSAHKLRFVLA